MKQILGLDVGTIVFTPGAAGAGTLVVSGVPYFKPARMLAVTNVTRRSLIYIAEGGVALAGAWSSVTATGGTLTLDTSTSGHNAGDLLRAFYESADAQFVKAGTISVSGSKGNFAPAFTDTRWTRSAQVTTWTTDYADGPIPGTRSTLMVNTMSPDNVGLNMAMNLNGRMDGRHFVASIYARGTGTLSFEGGTYSTSIATGSTDANGNMTVLTANWQRVYFPVILAMANPTNAYLRIKGQPGSGAITCELACCQLEFDVDGPSRFIDPTDMRYNETAISHNPDRTSVIAWGDSLTNGGTWRTQLSQLLNGSPVLNKGVGGETSTQIYTRMAAATVREKNFGVTTIWAGRNNFLDPTTVLADIEAMVGLVQNGRYLVLSITNQTTETIGGSNYNAILALNSALSVLYGTKFVDVRSVICQGSTTDSPRAIWMADATHLNTQGCGVIAQVIKDAILANGYFGSHQVDMPVPGVSQTRLLSVAAAVASTSLLPRSPRRGFTVVNDSTANLYLALGATASTTVFTAKVGPGGMFISENVDEYTGPVTGYWDAAAGNARITELL